MHDESLIRASLVRLLNNGKLDEVMAAEESRPSAASLSDRSTAMEEIPPAVEAMLKDNIPLELFDHFPSQWPIAEPIRDLREAWGFLQELRAVGKAINDRAAALGWVGDPIGPVTYSGAGGTYSYFRHFQNASIYWTQEYGVKEVHGAIRDRYIQMGAELSYLGFPTTDEISHKYASSEELRYSIFQGDYIYWTETRGAFLDPRFDITTTPDPYPTGVFFFLHGRGFTLNKPVTIWLDNKAEEPTSLGYVTAGPDGRFGHPPNENAYGLFAVNHPNPLRMRSTVRAVDEATGEESVAMLPRAVIY